MTITWSDSEQFMKSPIRVMDGMNETIEGNFVNLFGNPNSAAGIFRVARHVSFHFCWLLQGRTQNLNESRHNLSHLRGSSVLGATGLTLAANTANILVCRRNYT